MAAGVTQPGIAGTTTFLEDDANADSNLDADAGTYSPSDIVAKALPSADVTDLATFTKYIKSKCSIQNGDGAGVATTTFKVRNVRVAFDTGKTYLVSTVGQANRWTKFGDKIQGASGKPSGRNGAVLDCGAQTVFRGNVQIYGSMIRINTTGGIVFQPGAAGLAGELINCILETSGNGAIVFGATGQPLQLIDDISVVMGGTGVITQFLADFIDRIRITVTGSNPNHINTAGQFAARNVEFAGTPTDGDVRYNGGTPAALINPTFSGNARQYGSCGGIVEEWFEWSPTAVFYNTGAFVAGIPIQFLDVAGTVLLDLTTDALGGFDYNIVGPTVYDDAMKVRTITGATPVPTDRGPFTVRVNMGPSANPLYESYEYQFSWPYRNLPGNFGKQMLPMRGVDIVIYPAGFFSQAAPPPVIPMEASGVERIFAQVPEAA